MATTTMTIRRRLRRRKHLFWLTGYLGLCGGVILILLGEAATRPVWMYAGWAVLAIGVIASYVSFARIRCPRCNGNIGHPGIDALSGHWLWAKPIAFCPYCKVDLDEPFSS
jgi:hypothetical protein